MTMHRILTNKVIGVREIEAIFEPADPPDPDEIPHSRPEPPAGADKWPPGDAVREWLNVLLDIEMRDKVEQKLDDFPRTELADDPDDAAAIFSYLVRRDSGPISTRLRAPNPSLDVIEYAIGALRAQVTKRPANRPRKNPDEKRAGTFMWRVVEDARRLEQLLGEVYPQRLRGLVKEACGIAADRWGVRFKTLMKYREKNSTP